MKSPEALFLRQQMIAEAKAKADSYGTLSAWGLRSLIRDWEEEDARDATLRHAQPDADGRYTID